MKHLPRRTGLLVLAGFLTLFGCGPGVAREPQGTKKADAKAAEDKELEAEVKASLAKLGPDDRKLAEAQRWCAVEDDHRLGVMGPPFKVMVKGQPVFLCCKGCRKLAESEPEATLTKVKELKAKAKAEKAKGQ